MDAVLLLVVVALISLLIARVATMILTVTGMPRPMARFQARSALSGVGFTTSESETVVNHPVRRRVVMALMLVGNLGLAGAVAGLLGGFLRADAGETLSRGVVLAGALAAVYWLSRSAAVDRRLSRLIGRLLSRYTNLEVTDVDRLLHLSGPYSVGEVPVQEGTWLAGRTLGELRLRDEGILVLGVTRHDGSYLGVPDRATCTSPGDTLIVYGPDDDIATIAGRPDGPEGQRAHEAGVRLHRARRREEKAADRDAEHA